MAGSLFLFKLKLTIMEKPSSPNQATTQKKPKVKLSGQDGNVFNLIGLCSRALKAAGQEENAQLMSSECMHSHSYQEALGIMAKYCDIR